MLTPDDARRIAADLAAERGWPFHEPVSIRRARRWLVFGRPRWDIWTHADHHGGNVRVEIDDATGVVLSCGFNPR